MNANLLTIGWITLAMVTRCDAAQDPATGTLRVELRHDPRGHVVRLLDGNELASLDTLAATIDERRRSRLTTSATIHAEDMVCWEDVVALVNLCRDHHVDGVEFVFGVSHLVDLLAAAGLDVDAITRVATPSGPESADKFTLTVFHRDDTEVKCETFAAGHSCGQLPHWLVGVPSSRTEDAASGGNWKSILAREAASDRDPANVLLSNRRVELRADRFAPYGLVRHVMEQCAKVGLYKLEVTGRRPAAVKNRRHAPSLPGDVALATSYAPGRRLLLTVRSSLTLTTQVQVEDGGSVQPMPVIAGATTRTVIDEAHVDRVLEGNGTAGRVQRHFNVVSGWFGSGVTDTAVLDHFVSPFAGVTIELESTDSGTPNVQVVSGPAPQHMDALASHQVGLFLDALLPDGSAGIGAEWQLEAADITRALQTRRARSPGRWGRVRSDRSRAGGLSARARSGKQ